MKLEEKSDAEIITIANPMFDDITEGCRTKNWDRYSQYFTENDRSDPDHKREILDQWESNPVLVSISEEKQLLTILRRESEVVVVWKIGSTAIKGDFMLSLQITDIDSKLVLTGVGLH